MTEQLLLGSRRSGEVHLIVVPFRKSSFTPDECHRCVEVADLAGGGRWVRDSKLGEASPVLVVGAGAFAATLADIKSGVWG